MLIGLIGCKGSGKDTVADIIQKHMAANRTAFANKIKKVCAKHFNLQENLFHDQSLKEVALGKVEILGIVRCLEIMEDFGLGTDLTNDQRNYLGTIALLEMTSPRVIMQIVGTQILRYMDNEVHIRTIELDKLEGTTIVTDVRMPNELKHLRGYKGEFLPLYIQRDVSEDKVNENSHESEKNVLLIRNDCVKIENNGTLEELEEKVLDVLRIKKELKAGVL